MLVIPKDGFLDILKAEEDIEPVALAPVVVLNKNNEDLDEDEEPKMDQKELDQIDEGQIIEDIDAVALGPVLVADIVQIAVVWAAEMAT